MLTIERLDAVLTHKNITVMRPDLPEDSPDYDRNRRFTINGKEYTIEWWRNVCYLRHGDMEVVFRDVKQANTWPNHSKMNLQFYGLDGNTICIIPIEAYPVKEA